MHDRIDLILRENPVVSACAMVWSCWVWLLGNHAQDMMALVALLWHLRVTLVPATPATLRGRTSSAWLPHTDQSTQSTYNECWWFQLNIVTINILSSESPKQWWLMRASVAFWTEKCSLHILVSTRIFKFSNHILRFEEYCWTLKWQISSIKLLKKYKLPSFCRSFQRTSISAHVDFGARRNDRIFAQN